jgi:hypothetical protein
VTSPRTALSAEACENTPMPVDENAVTPSPVVDCPKMPEPFVEIPKTPVPSVEAPSIPSASVADAETADALVEVTLRPKNPAEDSTTRPRPAELVTVMPPTVPAPVAASVVVAAAAFVAPR